MQKQKKLISWYNYQLKPEHMEHPTGDSLTVPDESMSIREILKKHVTGLKIADSMQRQGFYDDDPDFDSPDYEKEANADIFDKSERLSYEKARSAELKKQYETSKARKKAPKQGEPDAVANSGESGESAAKGTKQGGSDHASDKPEKNGA